MTMDYEYESIELPEAVGAGSRRRPRAGAGRGRRMPLDDAEPQWEPVAATLRPGLRTRSGTSPSRPAPRGWTTRRRPRLVLEFAGVRAEQPHAAYVVEVRSAPDQEPHRAGRFATFGLAGTAPEEERNYLVDASAILPDLLAEGWTGGQLSVKLVPEDGAARLGRSRTGRSTSSRSRSTRRHHESAAGRRRWPDACRTSVRSTTTRVVLGGYGDSLGGPDRLRGRWDGSRPAAPTLTTARPCRRRPTWSIPWSLAWISDLAADGGRHDVAAGRPRRRRGARSSFRGWRTRLGVVCLATVTVLWLALGVWRRLARADARRTHRQRLVAADVRRHRPGGVPLGAAQPVAGEVPPAADRWRREDAAE